MKKTIIGVMSSLVLITAVATRSGNNSPKPVTPDPDTNQTSVKGVETVKTPPICDGSSVISNCTVEGITYKTYLYHPAVAEVSHEETVTTYEDKVTGYCTLCADSTYSPSCATGRGACSHHGGVAQWNAPRYARTPVYSTKKVVDAPAIDAYYDKVVQ